MKLYIIRHAKVDMKFPITCNAAEYDQFCQTYAQSPIVPTVHEPLAIQVDKVYVSNLIRSPQTAQILFPGCKLTQKDNIYEVPNGSFTDARVRLFLWMWAAMGRIQWFFNHKRQVEGRLQAQRRANQVISELEQDGCDCAMVSHGFFMKVLFGQLKKRGYRITGDNRIDIKNLQVILAEKEI